MNLRNFFYRGYYKDLDYYKIIEGQAKTDKDVGRFFSGKNSTLLAYSAPEQAIELLAAVHNKLPDYVDLPLQTSGQGLLIGIGYSHETGSLGENKLGFYFDPTSGLPVLPGHSVKGALRAAFPQKTDPPKVQKAKAKWLADILRKHGVKMPEGEELDFIQKLALSIFEGLDAEGKTRPISRHDIFLEAVMTQSGRPFLGRDALTPHDREKGLENPKPIPFIKVLPGVAFRFAFLLRQSEIDEIEVTTGAKKELFDTILCTLGVGAKTRGGYGIFEKPTPVRTQSQPKPGEDFLARIPSTDFKPLPLKTTEDYEALVVGFNEKNGKTRFVILAGMAGTGIPYPQKWPDELPVGTTVRVRIAINMNGQIQEIMPAS